MEQKNFYSMSKLNLFIYLSLFYHNATDAIDKNNGKRKPNASDFNNNYLFDKRDDVFIIKIFFLFKKWKTHTNAPTHKMAMKKKTK